MAGRSDPQVGLLCAIANLDMFIDVYNVYTLEVGTLHYICHGTIVL